MTDWVEGQNGWVNETQPEGTTSRCVIQGCEGNVTPPLPPSFAICDLNDKSHNTAWESITRRRLLTIQQNNKK